MIINNKAFGALLTDLSKAFDCICHNLLVAKLNAYGQSLPALKMIQDYLQNRKQRTQIGSSQSSWQYITSGVPQGSILGPLLLNIFLCDLFHEYQNNYFANYADDTAPYIVGDNTTEVLTDLSSLAQKLFACFAKNKMKVIHDKYHLLLSTQESFNIQIASFTLKSSKAKNF